MTISSQTWTEETVQAAGLQVQLFKGGSGEPLLIVHDEMGHQQWLKFHESLAQNHTLYIPSASGYGKTEPLDWIMNTRDMAGWYLHLLDDLGLDQVKVVGLSLGGWLAADMVTMEPKRFKKMVLVAPMGIKPPVGEIFDMFILSAAEWITKGIHDQDNTPEFRQVVPEEPEPDLVESWEIGREQSCRLGWKPYMHYRPLTFLLQRLKNLPTLIVWGKQDPLVPPSAGELYRESIQGSRLEMLDNCGHYPHIEKPDETLQLVQGFLADS